MVSHRCVIDGNCPMATTDKQTDKQRGRERYREIGIEWYIYRQLSLI